MFNLLPKYHHRNGVILITSCRKTRLKPQEVRGWMLSFLSDQEIRPNRGVEKKKQQFNVYIFLNNLQNYRGKKFQSYTYTCVIFSRVWWKPHRKPHSTLQALLHLLVQTTRDLFSNLGERPQQGSHYSGCGDYEWWGGVRKKPQPFLHSLKWQKWIIHVFYISAVLHQALSSLSDCVWGRGRCQQVRGQRPVQ